MNSRAIRISDGTSVTRGEGRTPSFFSKEQPTIINAGTIAELIAYAEENDTDVRLCLHQDAAARHHDMIIAQLAMSYFPPHCHEGKGETWNVLHGEMAVFVFDDEGGAARCAQALPRQGFFVSCRRFSVPHGDFANPGCRLSRGQTWPVPRPGRQSFCTLGSGP